MSRLRRCRPPRALRRPGVRLDNLALVPASLLPEKARYQAIANDLPPGEVLIVVPERAGQEREALERTAALLRAKGRHVTLLTTAQVGKEHHP